MLLKNMDVGKGLVNGARGRVDSFTKEGNPLVVFLGVQQCSPVTIVQCL